MRSIISTGGRCVTVTQHGAPTSTSNARDKLPGAPASPRLAASASGRVTVIVSRSLLEVANRGSGQRGQDPLRLAERLLGLPELLVPLAVEAARLLADLRQPLADPQQQLG